MSSVLPAITDLDSLAGAIYAQERYAQEAAQATAGADRQAS
jgi:hypothetical protein